MPSNAAAPHRTRAKSSNASERAAKDSADARIAQRRLHDLKAGKTSAIPAAEVYKKLGI